VILSHRFEFGEDSLVADHGEELQSLEEIEVDGGWVIADQVVILADVLDNFWEEGLVQFNGLCFVILVVAETDDLPSKFVEQTGKHVHLCLVLGGLSKERLVPDFSNVLMDCHRLCHLGLSVNEIRKVREFQAEVLLVCHEPIFESVVVLGVIINATISELIPDIGSNTPDCPVAENWSAVDINSTLSQELYLDVIRQERCLIFEICDISWENFSLKDLREVWIDLIFGKVLRLVVFVLNTCEL